MAGWYQKHPGITFTERAVPTERPERGGVTNAGKPFNTTFGKFD